MAREKLSAEEIKENLAKLDGWKISDEKLKKRFEFDNFAESLEFVNKVGEIAEATRSSSRYTFRLGLCRI